MFFFPRLQHHPLAITGERHVRYRDHAWMTRMQLLVSIFLVVPCVVEAADGDPRRVPTLIETLNSSNAIVRGEAAEELAAIGPEAKAAVPALLALLEDAAVYAGSPGLVEVAVNDAAQQALVAIGSEAVTALVDAAAEGEKFSSENAVFALHQIGPRAYAAFPTLAKRLSDADPSLRRAIISTLPTIDRSGNKTIPLLIENCRDEDERVRVEAVIGLGMYESAAGLAVPTLLQSLTDNSPKVRGSAARSLGAIGADADKVVPALIARLKDVDGYHYAVSNHLAGASTVANDAALALSRYGRPEAIPALIAALNGRIRTPNLSASPIIRSLATFGAAAEPAVPYLVAALRDGEMEAAVALAAIGPAARGAIDELKAIVASESGDLRVAAAVALVGIDADAHPEALRIALSSLRITGGDTLLDVEPRFAAEVLFGRGPVAAPFVPELIGKFEGKYSVNRHIAEALGRIGPAAKAAGPVLVKHLGSSDDIVVIPALLGIGSEMIPLLVRELESPERRPAELASIAKTLGRFSPPADIAVPSLVRLLNHDSRRVRRQVARAIGRIRSRPGIAVPGLTTALEDPRPDIRAHAAMSLGRFGEDAQTAVPALLVALADEYIVVRASAARALGRIGKPADSVQSALNTAGDDPNPYVRAAARQALRCVRER